MQKRNRKRDSREAAKSSSRQQPRASLRFDNEILLQQAIAGLIGRMPGISDVQILQGAQERGKDIVFRAEGPLGESTTCACVVKNVRFSGKAGARHGLRALTEQIEQALDTAYLDGRAEEQRVHKVYVMSPHELSVAAISSVAGKLRERMGLITFITGAELYRMFLQFWPDYLADEHTHLKQLSAALEDASGGNRALLSLASEYDPSMASRAVPEVYVQPSFEREVFLYRVEPGVDMVLPEERLSHRWSKKTVRGFGIAVRKHLALLRFLAAWPFPSLRIASLLPQFEMEVLRLVNAVRDAFVNAFRIESGSRVASFDNIDSDVFLILRRPEKTALEEEFRRANERLRSWWRQLRDTTDHVSTSLSAALEEGDDVLEDPLFLLASSIDDCLRAAPSAGAFAVIGRVRATFAKGLHLRRKQAILLVGGPGSGKTSFCTRNALLDAETLQEDRNSPVPVYVPLHRLASPNGRTFAEVFLADLESSALVGVSGARISELPKRVYLDGLDEVADSQLRSELLLLAADGPRQEPYCQIIITARDYLYDRALAWLPRIALSGLDEQGLSSLVCQWLDEQHAQATDFLTQIERLPALKQLVRVPLLAVVTLLVYKRTRRLPTDRARLYNAFVALLCGGWDLAKGVLRPSEFGVATKIQALGSLAAEVHGKRKRDFTRDQVIAAAARVLSRRKPLEHERFLDEAVRDGIITQTGGRLHFCHLSFQEFLTAKECIGDPGYARAHALLTKYLVGDDWWREVLKFYIGLAENPERVADWLGTHLPRRKIDERADALWGAFADSFPDFDLESWRATRPRRRSRDPE